MASSWPMMVRDSCRDGDEAGVPGGRGIGVQTGPVHLGGGARRGSRFRAGLPGGAALSGGEAAQETGQLGKIPEAHAAVAAPGPDLGVLTGIDGTGVTMQDDDTAFPLVESDRAALIAAIGRHDDVLEHQAAFLGDLSAQIVKFLLAAADHVDPVHR